MPWKNGSQRGGSYKNAGHCLTPDIPWPASHPGWKKGFAEGGVFFWHQVGSNDPSIRKPCGCVSKLGNQKIPWKMKKNVSRKPMDLRIPPETQPCPCFSHQPSSPSFALGSTRRREASMPAFNRRSRKIDAYKRKPCRKHHIISHPTCLFLPFKTKSSNIKLPTFTKVLYNLCSLFSTRTWPQTF